MPESADWQKERAIKVKPKRVKVAPKAERSKVLENIKNRQNEYNVRVPKACPVGVWPARCRRMWPAAVMSSDWATSRRVRSPTSQRGDLHRALDLDYPVPPRPCPPISCPQSDRHTWPCTLAAPSRSPRRTMLRWPRRKTRSCLPVPPPSMALPWAEPPHFPHRQATVKRARPATRARRPSTAPAPVPPAEDPSSPTNSTKPSRRSTLGSRIFDTPPNSASSRGVSRRFLEKIPEIWECLGINI